MTITINGDKKEFAGELSISALLEQENVESPDMVSVQLNEEFVEADDYATTTVKEGDAVDFLYFMGGGSI